MSDIGAKQTRISRQKEISELLRRGRRWRCDVFRVVWLPGKADHDRLAVLVGRRHGNAVRRNRIKRAFREVFRNHASRHAPFLDIVIQPRLPERFNTHTVEEKYVSWLRSVGK